MVERKVKKPKESLKRRLSRFGNRAQLAWLGTIELLKKPKHIITTVVWFLVFLYVLTFFSSGSSNWSILWSGASAGDKFGLLGRVFLDMFGNFTNLYGVVLVLMSLLQGICIMHLAYAWKNRERGKAMDGASTGGLGALLGFIALGCPSCGVTFVTPILTAIAGTSALALTEGISRLFTIAAFALLLYTVVQTGFINFVIISDKKYKEKHVKD